MNTEIFSFTLQDLETLLSKSYCTCHIINPNKTRIILWKSQDDPDTYCLRIGIQKFTSYPLKDKHKALYWRFKFPEIKELTINPDPHNPITTETLSNYGDNPNSNSS